VLIMLAAGVISAFMNNSGDVAWQEVFQVHLHVIPRYDDEPLGQRDTLLAQATSEQAGQVSAR
jgi:diadenosine tetraphosphate (Ap4A) HIT family hydrolase